MAPARTSTRKTSQPATKRKNAKASSSTRSTTTTKKTQAPPEQASDEEGEDLIRDGEYQDDESLHSDALDDDEEFDEVPSKKRKRSSDSPKKKKSSPKKRAKKTREDEDEEEELELEEGQEIAGVVVQAPKTGRVPPGQISQNTVDFLNQLKKPECNDREWFKLHEPVYRLAEKEWKDFIEAFTDVLVENDPQIPHLPPKDVIYRIYRDVRFSNDKTPYKKGFSASFSRSGRKGIFAGYHIAVIPGDKSLIAAGVWHPGKNELQTIRNKLMRSSARFRKIISAPKFVEYFGAAKPHPKGLRQNVWGMEDELKTAPKGVDKTHKDIDLLKCRSFVVIHYFSDDVVLDPNFKETLGKFVNILRPFVHCLNDMMTLPDDSSDEEDEDEEQEEGSGEAGDEGSEEEE